jgi:hypothetical protein
VPWHWRRIVHGWPGVRSRDLQAFGALLAGRSRVGEWPDIAEMGYQQAASDGVVPHPYDDGVLLGTMRSLRHGASAIVSLCRVGTDEPLFEQTAPEDRIDSRLIDSSHAADNANLHFLLHDAADAVRGLRAEGHTVLLHCVAAQQRTPSVALATRRCWGIRLRKPRLGSGPRCRAPADMAGSGRPPSSLGPARRLRGRL